MAYTADRLIHDADSHIMEVSSWLRDHADPAWRDRLPELFVASVAPGEDSLIDQYTAHHRDPEYRAADAEQIMLRKNWKATGSLVAEDRPGALDLLGFASQAVFNTFANGVLVKLEHATDAEAVDRAYGAATAHNRAITEFCKVDPRLLAVGYVPLMSIERAPAAAAEAVAFGCDLLMIASACPSDHSPSHVGLDAVWAIAQDAGVPVVTHVGGAGQLLSPMYFKNGLPAVADFHGGAENFRSVDYMAIPNWPMQTLSTLLFDGVLDRFPRLKWGVIEQGASWLPGWMRNLDAAFGAFRKNEERLKRLSAPPSEIVRRQVRVTPYPHEDTGWIIEQSGPEICLFSSDYPHVEGGRQPLHRFDTSLASVSDGAKQRFYFDNFVDLMGDTLARHGLPTMMPAGARAA